MLCFKVFSVPLLVLQVDCEMCEGYKWVVCAASCLGLPLQPAPDLIKTYNFLYQIQSIVWTGLGIAGALLYLNIIPVQPYQEPKDFFRVSLVKLYFEGPNSKIDGSYLGQFNEDYKNPNVIDLLRPDKVFAVLVAYVMINVLYFFISILLFTNRKSKKPDENRRLLDIALGWSCITFLLCVIDVVFGYFLFRDFLQIKDYVNKSPHALPKDAPLSDYKPISDLIYIPLALTLVSGRAIVLWVWNFVIAYLFFFDALCCKKILRRSLQPEQEREQELKVIVPPKPSQVLPPVKLINKSYSTSYDITKDCDSIDVKRSVEAVTSFSDDNGKPQGCRVYSRRDWNYAPSDGTFQNTVWHPKLHVREWNAINEGYESDEDDGSVVLEQTSHSNQKEDSGQRKIKIVKPPIGKRVSIPIPPPLPVSESCSC